MSQGGSNVLMGVKAARKQCREIQEIEKKKELARVRKGYCCALKMNDA